MKLLNIIFTKNRLNTLKESLRTVFENTNINADKTIIIDDNSEDAVKDYLISFQKKYPNVELHFNNTNEGYARNYWKAYNLVKFYNPEYVFFIESDYIFRKNYLEESIEFFRQLPDLFVVKGFAHKEYYNRDKIIPWFKEATIEQFGTPLNSCENLYIENKLDSYYGQIKYMYSSHACGTILINWHRINKVNQTSGYNLDRWILKACKNNQYGEILNDGLVSSLYAKIWDSYYNACNERYSESGVVFISDFGIADHRNSGGLNHDGILEEGYSTVTANFPEDYNNFIRPDSLL